MKVEEVDDSAQAFERSSIQDAPDPDVHVLDLLVVLSRRRRTILLFTAAMIVLTVILVLVLPSRYTAETVVLPPGQNASMSSALLNQLGGSTALASVAGAGLGIKNPGDMYVALFHTRTLEDAVINRFHLMERFNSKEMSDARYEFERHTSVALGIKDGLIRINVTDRDPRMAADIANGYVDEFRKQSATLAISEASQRRAFFQQQLLEANENLAKAEETMKSTEQSTGVLQVDSQARLLIESAATIRAQIVAKLVELEAMRSYGTEDNPQIVTEEQQIGALKGQLSKLTGNDTAMNSDIILPKGRIPQAGLEYIRAYRDVRYYETVTELIARQFEIAKLDEARQGTLIQVADVAIPPDRRSFPKRTISVIVMGFLSFFGACAWCIASAAFQRIKKNPDERRRLDALRATFSKS